MAFKPWAMIWDRSIGRKLAIGFGIVCVMFTMAIGMMAVGVGDVGSGVSTIAGRDAPLTITASRIAADIQGSLVALRGWMLEGNATDKERRAAAWRHIDANRGQMDALVAEATPEIAERWNAISRALPVLRAAQDKVEALAHSEQEQPAVVMLAKQVSPLTNLMGAQLTVMMDEEGHLPATPERKELLRQLAEFRGPLGLAVSNLRAYLLSGDPQAKTGYKGFFDRMQKASAYIMGHRDLLTETQAAAYAKVDEAYAKFRVLPDQLFAIRESEHWNETLYEMAHNVVPPSEQVLQSLVGTSAEDPGLSDRIFRALQASTSTIDHATKSLVTLAWGLLAAGLVLAGTTAVLTARAITRPIKDITRVMEDLAAGRTETTIPGMDRADEIGSMARATEVFRENAIERGRMEHSRAEDFDRQSRLAAQRERAVEIFATGIAAVIKDLSGSVAQMRDGSERMAGIAGGASSEANGVAGAIAEASSNVQSGASAAGQLLSSIGRVREQVANSTRIAEVANADVGRTNEMVEGLNAATKRVEEVLTLINVIASQTNLLALNATIEASRAGDAGRGFAVVANEVKALASQTARATDEIAEQVTAMRAATSAATRAIDDIGRTIVSISDITGAISGAVAEQADITTAITHSMDEAASRTTMVARSVVGVTATAHQVSATAAEVHHMAETLDATAEALRGQVGSFLAEIA